MHPIPQEQLPFLGYIMLYHIFSFFGCKLESTFAEWSPAFKGWYYWYPIVRATTMQEFRAGVQSRVLPEVRSSGTPVVHAHFVRPSTVLMHRPSSGGRSTAKRSNHQGFQQYMRNSTRNLDLTSSAILILDMIGTKIRTMSHVFSLISHESHHVQRVKAKQHWTTWPDWTP